MKQPTKLNPNFRVDLIMEYKNKNGLTYDGLLQELSEFDESILEINDSTFKQYIYGKINVVPLNLLKAMANLVGETLDHFCYNNSINNIDITMQNKLGISAETTNNLINNRPNRWLFNADKRPKDISKKDYTAILNLFLEKKIKSGIGKKSAIDVFTGNVLNLFICTVVYDKTILETFKDNFTNLSSTINAYKTKPAGKTDIDMKFTEIFNTPTIQKAYRNATHELHDTIDQLLEITLKECFDSINPNITLF